MAKTPPTDHARPIDPRTFLSTLDKDTLARQIEAAKAKVADAKGELHALLTLEKIRAIKAGEFLKGKGGRRKKQASEATAAAADPAPRPSAPVARSASANDEASLKADIVAWLSDHRSAPVKPRFIAQAIGAEVSDVIRVLHAHPDTFVKRPAPGGDVGYTIV